MSDLPVIDRLAGLPGLCDIPRDQLQWLLDHGELRRAPDGAVFRSTSAESMGLLLLISGRFSVRVDQGGTEREVREVTPGHPTGHLPYSRMTTARGYLVADGPVEFLSIAFDDIREMTRACYDFTTVCVQEMLARVRIFKSDDKRQEKMAALGRLSAGLAHELNNPASAAARAARELAAAQAAVVAASRDLGAAGLGEEASLALRALESLVKAGPGATLSPLESSDREEQIADWLDARGIEAGLAYPLAESGLTVADLDRTAPAFGSVQMAVAVGYIAAEWAVLGLTADIVSATDRIHSLVAAVKKHTHMDRPSAIDAIRVEQHLTDAVTIMKAKASLKGVVLDVSFEPDLPVVEGSVSDINQVWIHLVDNAIDAARESGRVAIDARRDHGKLVVRVIDDGAGIPEEHQERVFEPFFTTKEVGEGRGLGLDIVRTVVLNHRGTVHLTSGPGRTEFCVTLPASAQEERDGRT